MTMRLTIIEVGHVPDPLQDRFSPYSEMFRDMFVGTGLLFQCDVVGAEAYAAGPGVGREVLHGAAVREERAGSAERHRWRGVVD